MGVTVRVDLVVPPADTPTTVWVRPTVRPDGEMLVDSDTVPAKSSTLPRLISVDPELP